MTRRKEDKRAITGENVLARLRERPPARAAPWWPRGAVPLHAMLAGAGRERRQAEDYDWHGLRRGRAEFALCQHTFAGRGVVEFEGRRHAVEPGQTMVLFFPHDHRYRLMDDQPWDFFWLTLHGTEVMRLWRVAVSRLGPVVTLDRATLDAAAGACLAALDDRLTGPGHASGLAYALAAALLDRAHASAAAARAPRPVEVRRAIDHLRRHLDRPMTVQELADVAGYSKWHFTRRFAASEGVSPGEFIMRQRMKAAAALLLRSDDPIKAVAFRCGFDDPNYFAKAFRRCFRVSPGAYRKQRSLA